MYFCCLDRDDSNGGNSQWKNAMEGKSVYGLTTEDRKCIVLATFLRENRTLPAMPVT